MNKLTLSLAIAGAVVVRRRLRDHRETEGLGARRRQGARACRRRARSGVRRRDRERRARGAEVANLLRVRLRRAHARRPGDAPADGRLSRAHPAALLTVEGHCDDSGSPEYNLALGDRRARVARDYLKKLGVEDARLNSISYGEEKPAVAGTDDAARERTAAASSISRTGRHELRQRKVR